MCAIDINDNSKTISYYKCPLCFKCLIDHYALNNTEWRLEELERINNSLTGAERKAALCTLLDQETQLLASIGRHQIAAGEENKTESVQSLLNKVCFK